MNSLKTRSKPISNFLLSRSPPSRIVYISLFTTSTPPSLSGSGRRSDDESKNVRVSVWWDIENCAVPNGANVFKITQSITSAVRSNGIKGPLQVNAFGDVSCLTRTSQEALSSTGVNLVHIPHGGKNSADRSLLVDLMYWVSQNPPPAHILLISGDRDFAGILHKLRMNNYNILLAGKEGKQTPGVLCSAASIMWHWNELAKGENLSGRHFNQPPDGPFNSWYGHFRGPLEDPYAVPEQQSSSAADNSSNAEISSESKSRAVPITVSRQLRRIINAHPKGLTISEFRSELTKMKVRIDKDFYGHKKISRFLLSIPHIVNVESLPDGRFFLRPVTPKVQEHKERNETSVGSVTEENQDIGVTNKANEQSHSITRMMDVEPKMPISSYVDHREITVEEKATKESPKKQALDVGQKDNQVDSTKEHPGTEALNAELVEIPVAAKEDQNSKGKIGLLKRLWFGTGIDAKEASNDIPSKLDTSIGSPEKSTAKEEGTKLTDQHGGQHLAHSSTVLSEDSKNDLSDKSEASPGFVTRVISWWKSWRNPSVETSAEQSIEEPGFVEEKSHFLDSPLSKDNELFSKATFWSGLQSFLKTRRGSDIVSNSKSRKQIAERLQKEGPLVLRHLQESDLQHLVKLLLSEKRWIAEFPTKTPRFKILHPPVERSAELQPQNVQSLRSNGLSSIFNDSSSLHKKPSENSRSQVLADCQKLLDELLSQMPEGFNMALFKKQFLEKYGYPLDHQKLGYQKLVSLLQIMPGVKIESARVYSDKVLYSPGIESLGLADKSSCSDSDASDSLRKKKDGESPWEDLGAVAKHEREFSVGSVNGHYEPSVTDDDDFSELGEDASSSPVKAEDQNRSRVDEEDSSLLQILDSWYSTKDERKPQGYVSNAEGLVDCSEEESESPQSSSTSVNGVDCSKEELESPQSSSTSVNGEETAASAANHAGKQRPQKRYNFVSDPTETKKDKLIDGILGTLKKPGETRVQE